MKEQQYVIISRNFLQESIICKNNPNKKIPKSLLQQIIPHDKLPSNLLSEQNVFINFMKKELEEKKQNYIEEFIKLYQNVGDFKLLKFGEYCGIKQDGKKSDSYIVFSQHLTAYICLRNNEWEGFCYRVGKSAYVGQFKKDLRADGVGRALFIELKKNQNSNIPNTIYHLFKGNWKSGQLINGTRKTYSSISQYQSNISHLEYDGQFANFQFHGEGTKKKNDREVQGIFEKGKFIKNLNKSNKDISSRVTKFGNSNVN